MTEGTDNGVPLYANKRIMTNPDGNDETPCQQCKKTEDEERLVLCDFCDRGWHIYCINPPMEHAPTGDWNCPNCDPNSVSDCHRVEKILAKRVRGGKPEYLIQWDDSTKLNNSWEPKRNIVSPALIDNYEAQNFDEEESYQPKKKTPNTKKSPRQRRKSMDDDDSDVSEEEERPKARPKRKASRKKALSSDDEDDSDEDERPMKKNQKAKPKKKPAPPKPKPSPIKFEEDGDNDDKSLAKEEKKKGDDEDAFDVKEETKVGQRPYETLTYTEAITEALNELGDSTAAEVQVYIQKRYKGWFRLESKTWKNSLSGAMSSHFVKVPSSDGTVKPFGAKWTLPSSNEPKGRGRPKDAPKSSKASKAFEPSDSEEEDELPKKKKSKPKPKPKEESPQEKPTKIEEDPLNVVFGADETADTRVTIEDGPPKVAIDYINSGSPVRFFKKLDHLGDVFGVCFSSNGEMMATASGAGIIRVWDCNTWDLIKQMFDQSDENIQEFYSITFVDNDKKIAVAGKSKNRKVWSEEDEDNEVLPTPIKIFDLDGNVVTSLEGHTEEILSLIVTSHNDRPYIISSGQDGRIFKWKMASDFSHPIERRRFRLKHDVDISSSVSTFSNGKQRFVLAACDRSLSIFDFETEQCLHEFKDLYGSLVDHVMLVDPLEISRNSEETFILTRGVEAIDRESKRPMAPSRCHLRKLTIGKLRGALKISMETESAFDDLNYNSNVWLMKLASNGRYLLAGTSEGGVYVWNLRTTQLTAILKEPDAEGVVMRSIGCHPTKPIIAITGGDSSIRLYEKFSEN